MFRNLSDRRAGGWFNGDSRFTRLIMDSTDLQDLGATLIFAFSALFWGIMVLAFVAMVGQGFLKLAKGHMWRTGTILSTGFLLFGIFWGMKVADMSGEVVRAETIRMQEAQKLRNLCVAGCVTACEANRTQKP